MVTNLQPLINEVEKLSAALDMDKNEFSQRAMRSSILSTSYSLTGEAIEKHKVNYHKALNLKVGIAIAQVFEWLAEKYDGFLPLGLFLEKTTDAYMRVCGFPFYDRINRRSEIKGQVVWKLQRSLDHNLIQIVTKNRQRFVKMFPDISSLTFAMLMNPETMLRSPYVKAMAQTIGGMATVDKEQKKLTADDLSDSIQDKLRTAGLLEAKKSSTVFAGSHIEPFHKRKKVSFYSEVDDMLFILPTFPLTGSSISTTNLPAIMSSELAYEMIAGNLEDLTQGLDPALVSIYNGDKNFYFNRQFPYVQKLEEFLGAKFSRYIPKNEAAFSGLGEIQSKLGEYFEDGSKVAKFLQTILVSNLKDSELDQFERRIMSVLYLRLNLVHRNSKGEYSPIEEERHTLDMIKGLCNVTNPIGKVMSSMTARDEY